MSPQNVMEPLAQVESQNRSKLLDQYGCGLIHFAGTDNALYERHLPFDNVIPLAAADERDRFEAFARSVRDILSQRWALTENTYEHVDPNVYYLSMEFLIGRSLVNNVTNLLLSPLAKEAVRKKNMNWAELLEQEPDAALGNGSLSRLAASSRWPLRPSIRISHFQTVHGKRPPTRAAG